MKTYESLISLMKKCWDHDSKNRPEFKEIVLTLSDIEEQMDYISSGEK